MFWYSLTILSNHCCLFMLSQYVPENDTSVCGRVLHQTLPPDASSGGSQAGIWFFDCDKPAGFICESNYRLLITNCRCINPMRASACNYASATEAQVHRCLLCLFMKLGTTDAPRQQQYAHLD
jgi:hypothetical protein